MPITLEQAIAAETVMSIIEVAKYEPRMPPEESRRDYIYALNVRFLEKPDDVWVEVKLSDGRRAIFSMRNDFWEGSTAGEYVAFNFWRPSAEELNDWHISPTGLLVIWPSLQRSVYVPSLLEKEMVASPWHYPQPEGKRIGIDVGIREAREECIKRLDSGMIFIPGEPIFPPDDEGEEEGMKAQAA